jgi:uncharacterized membrane protein
MKPHNTLKSTTLAFAALLALPAAAFQYEVINIGTLPGSDFSLINAINDNGTIVGTAFAGSESRGWQWNQQNGMNEVYGFGYDRTTAVDINDQGFIIGSFTEDSTTKGFRYKNGAWWHLSPIPGQSESSPSGINNLNQVVGISDFASDARATGWLPILPDTPGFALPSYGNQVESSARALNDLGESVGSARLAGSQRATIFRNNNTLFDLHGLLPLGTTFSLAHDNNESGWVVGQFTNATDAYGFVFNLELGMVTVGEANDQTSLVAINENGQAVGSNGLADAVLWHSSTGRQSLNDLIDPNSGWNLTSARDINDNGWIIGQGSFNGVNTTYLARPTESVPEPASMSIIALGIGALAVRTRRKK